jgi:hypothetical protein
VALPEAYALTSIALRVSGERKPLLHDKGIVLEEGLENIVAIMYIPLALTFRISSFKPQSVFR